MSVIFYFINKRMNVLCGDQVGDKIQALKETASSEEKNNINLFNI